MCGTLKYENIASKLGDPVTIFDPYKGNTITKEWSGYIQNEKLNWWKQQTRLWLIHILSDSIFEQERELAVTEGRVVGVCLGTDVILNGKIIGRAGTVRVVTRPPMNDFEKSIHHRWPIIGYTHGLKGIHTFSEKDVIDNLPLQQRLI